MDVILLERIEKLGQMGDVVNVKTGFARNYLLPQNKALRKTKQNLSRFESERAQLEADNLTRKNEAENISILYGGSVNSDNASELISINGVNGFLIGGASLNVSIFSDIVKIVSKNDFILLQLRSELILGP